MLKAIAIRAYTAGIAYALGAAFVLALSRGEARNAPSPGGTDTIALAELPTQGRATFRLIREGGPLPPTTRTAASLATGERLLPSHKRGYYREYTVRTPGASNRGARRIVCGGPRARRTPATTPATTTRAFGRSWNDLAPGLCGQEPMHRTITGLPTLFLKTAPSGRFPAIFLIGDYIKKEQRRWKCHFVTTRTTHCAACAPT